MVGPYWRGALASLTLLGALAFSACVPSPNARAVDASGNAVPTAEEIALDRAIAERLEKPVDFDSWKGMSHGATYLAPKSDFVADDGGVDVIVHFNAGQLADKEWRKSGANAVIMSATYGQFGTQAYKDAFADPNRFGAMLSDLVERVHATHVRKLALVSWSAGYAATSTILREPRYYAMVDTVVLLDGLHTDYTRTHEVDTRMMTTLLGFAADAADGKKTMIVVHSSIVPPGYASTTETAAALCEAVHVERTFEERKNARGMVERYHADRGNLHVRGYKGGEAKDHMDQLALIGDIAREHIAEPWTRAELMDRRTLTSAR